jgi:hypothetical protein
VTTTAIPVGFDYVFGLAQKLPPEERKQLAQKLATAETKPEEPEWKPKITRFDGYILVENPGNPYPTPEDEERCRRKRDALRAKAEKIPPEKRAELIRQSIEAFSTLPPPTDEDCAIWDEMERRKAEACHSI